MVRVFIMIIVAGFVLSVASLSAAVAIGGPELVSRGGWGWSDGSWKGKHWGWDDHDDRHPATDLGPQTTRTLPWSGVSSLDIDLTADVQYVQAAGPASVTVTGPQRAVEQVVLRGESLRYDGRHHRNRYPTLTVVIRAPGVTAFELSGGSTLAIEGYRQDTLKLDISGGAEVTVKGETRDIDLEVSGSGDADLGGLKAKGARVDLSGAGDATIAPTEWAEIEVSGAGDVRLLTRPARIDTEISGAGRVQEAAPAVTATPGKVIPGAKT